MVKRKAVIGVLGMLSPILASLFWQASFGLAQLPHVVLGTFSHKLFFCQFSLKRFLKTPSFGVTLSSQIYQNNIFPCIHIYQ